MNDTVIEYLKTQNFTYVESREKFLTLYPEREPHEYRACPNQSPNSYPCMVADVDFWHNPTGQDEYIMCILYPE